MADSNSSATELIARIGMPRMDGLALVVAAELSIIVLILIFFFIWHFVMQRKIVYDSEEEIYQYTAKDLPAEHDPPYHGGGDDKRFYMNNMKQKQELEWKAQDSCQNKIAKYDILEEVESKNNKEHHKGKKDEKAQDKSQMVLNQSAEGDTEKKDKKACGACCKMRCKITIPEFLKNKLKKETKDLSM
ncbi:hypothetical protein XENTR_v10005446 [Xenopus tropicalis]|uniref:Uncharacterized protein LOC116408681 n=1 Tax=Xenopus tropicalis TaxID=8364 RepID=A0A8J1J2Y8_XENTR|nr:uncharacterized protein LOC116408681 [Xenopus tropicalis]KAE8622974.1 hypothetical protein XENTR_v10005446 [Xenopus tropicalis]